MRNFSISPTEEVVHENKYRLHGLIGGVLFLLITIFFEPPADMPKEAWLACGMAGLMAIWWITEAIPLAATALVPLVFIPLLGLGSIKLAAAPYASDSVYLFMGGFMIAIAMERWNLHLRLALHTIKLVSVFGTRPDIMVAGIMLATFFVSMWISNTAAAVMMIPIAVTIIKMVQSGPTITEQARGHNFAIATMLGIAYSATIGGMATPVGTPPNTLARGFLDDVYGIHISFFDWMSFALPISVAMLVCGWVVLTKLVYRSRLLSTGGEAGLINAEIAKLGKISVDEMKVLTIFTLTALFWVFKEQVNAILPEGSNLSDSGIAITSALLLFIIPAHSEKRNLLVWSDAEKIPWGVLVLFGGGLSMAMMLTKSGFADWLSMEISQFDNISVMMLILISAVALLIITEFMSNMAAISAFLPIIAAAVVGIGGDAANAAVISALAVSCAFMMPVGTPPNAIVFASGYVKASQMAKAGLYMNIIALTILLFASNTIIPYMLGK